MGLRSTRRGDSNVSAPVPSSLDPHLVDAFTRLPLEEPRDGARANPALGLRPTGAAGTTYFNTGIKRSPAASAVGTPAGLEATPGKDLSDQSSEFKALVESLPASVREEVKVLIKDPTNRILVEAGLVAGTASVHNMRGGCVSTMKASWDISRAVDNTAVKTSASSVPSVASLTSGMSIPPTKTDGNVFAATAGIALVHQSKEFQDAVSNIPKAVQDRLCEQLSDQNNHVFLDVNVSEGKVALVCRNGLKTSTTNASWIPGFGADHQYVPDVGSAQYQATNTTTPGSATHAPRSVVADSNASGVTPPSTVDGDVFACEPGKDVALQSEKYRNAFYLLPKAIQDRVTVLLQDEGNQVYIDLNLSAGKAAIVCKNGLRTATLSASWNPRVHTPHMPQPHPSAIGHAHSGPHLNVRLDESVKPADRADPSTGLRKLF